jgi:uncharacterized protein YdeI (YjbR/CyaY-like superfamily)
MKPANKRKSEEPMATVTKSRSNPKVDGFFNNAKKWKAELAKLRTVILDSELTEELKWAKPCYAFQKSNLAVLCGLKESCAVGFLKGALLKDDKGILIKPGEHSQSMRWMKFTSVREIVEMQPVLKAYIREAIEAERAGLKVIFKKKPEPIPEELQHKLDESPALKTAFHALTPGRQRAYILYFSAAKQSKTRVSRIEKYTKQILNEKGMDDR